MIFIYYKYVNFNVRIFMVFFLEVKKEFFLKLFLKIYFDGGIIYIYICVKIDIDW